MPEECGHRRIALQRRAVHFDKSSGDLVTQPLELIHPPCKLALAGSSRPHEEKRSRTAHHDPLDLVNHCIEASVSSFDPALEERRAVRTIGSEARGDGIVPGEVEIDRAPRANCARCSSRWLGLEQLAGKETRFGK